ncbi:MAG: addiction module protein [Meiothermus sp.]|nr:addiction module protein [Meiothermus sp.]
MSKQQVLEQALSLSLEERADLAHELLLSLEETTPEENARRWGEVAAKRAEKIRSGEIKGIPTEEVLRDVKSRMG